ncbi:MAG: Farnesyl diphosphate synthase [Opitutia bacterium UBA7350]|nr:MAG: Farnesyl diphosphate synthase [Opitutae bacterium UBA7350]
MLSMTQLTGVFIALKEKLKAFQIQTEAAIDSRLPDPGTRPARIHTAMRYAVMNGGKRIRPVLLLAASELLPKNANPEAAAVAIECLHSYTLIHDDLPCMDDSDLRRGNPSCHKEFDEATALLAGDALLTYAFELLSREYVEHPLLANKLVSDLAFAAGSLRLIGGQMEDVELAGKNLDHDALLFIHENKTAALITAALTMGLRFCDPKEEQLSLIKKIGYHLGMNFQIVDDILDATTTAETMGKPTGADAQAMKTTYPALYGLADARKEADKHTKKAVQLLDTLGGNNEFLIKLTQELEKRAH